MASSPGNQANQPQQAPSSSIPPPKPPPTSLAETLKFSPKKAKDKLTSLFSGNASTTGKDNSKTTAGPRHHPYSQDVRPNRSRASVTGSDTSATGPDLTRNLPQAQTAQALDAPSDLSSDDGLLDGDHTVRLDAQGRAINADGDDPEDYEDMYEFMESADDAKAGLRAAAIQAANYLATLVRLDEAGHETAADLDAETTANIQYLASTVLAGSTNAVKTALDKHMATMAAAFNEIKTGLNSLKNETTAQISSLKNDTAARLDKYQLDTSTRLDRLEKTRQPTTNATTTTDPKASFATGPVFKPAGPARTPAQRTTHNQTKAHHPSRLIVNTGYPQTQTQLPDADKLALDINAALQKEPAAKHLRVVTVKWNKRNNCILTVLEGQTGAELGKHAALFTHLFAAAPDALDIREDKRWYKIQVNGVRTGTQDAISHGPYAPETLHAELCAKNPVYANAAASIIQKPRFTRSPQELAAQGYSSIVFATDDEDVYRTLLQDYKKLNMFNRWCELTAFADCPPVTQCKTCFSLDHHTAKHPSDDKARCRLCGSTEHDEAKHAADCSHCPPTNDMDVDQPVPCTHNLRCVNCHEADRKDDTNHPSDSRRCPIRLDRYGTARQRERHQRNAPPTSNKNGSAKRAQRKKPGQTTQPAAAPPATVTSQNRFGPLAEPSVDNLMQELEKKGLKLTRDQAELALKMMVQKTQGNDWNNADDNGW